MHLTGMGGNYLDDFIVEIDGTYHDITSNGNTQNIEQSTATSLTGPYRYTGTGNWTGWRTRLEGPALLHLPDGAWRIYVDSPWNQRFYYADSTNDLRSFSALHELPELSGTVRHGTVIADN